MLSNGRCIGSAGRLSVADMDNAYSGMQQQRTDKTGILPAAWDLREKLLLLAKKVCSAADERIESRLCTGAATDISCFINGYPTGDFNGRGQKQNCGYWIPRASAGSWKGFGSSRKRLSAKENRGIYSGKNAPKIAYISVLLPAFMV